jgi:hypothetical protein
MLRDPRLLAALLYLGAAAAALPTWSWARMQSFIHCANFSGPLSLDAATAMAASGFTVIEKYQDLAGGFSDEEQKAVAAAQAIRAVNPSAAVLYYAAVDLARTWYAWAVALDARPECEARNADGSLVAHPSSDHGFDAVFHVPDYATKCGRAAFLNSTAAVVGTDDPSGNLFDGVFIDGYRDPGAWAAHIIPNASAAEQAAWLAGAASLGPALAALIGESTVRLVNGGDNPQRDWPGSNGVSIEFFYPADSDIEFLISAAAQAGVKWIEVHNYAFSDENYNETIAAYLVGVSEGAYLGIGAAWDTCVDWLQYHARPEFSRPLGGPPDGPAKHVGGVWTRSFGGSATTVWLNTSSNLACVRWADGSTTGLACATAADDDENGDAQPVLHPFAPGSPHGVGDVDGPFEHGGVFHLFVCCSWAHLAAPSPAGPWAAVGDSSIGAGFISGSATVVGGVPRVVAAYNRGNNPHCCDGAPSNGTWPYPCVANPPAPACWQSYTMSLPLNLSDPFLAEWQQPAAQQTLVNYTEGAAAHGWVQQDPSRAWEDPAAPGRWLFLGGTSVNGSAASPAGRPVIELFGSRGRDGSWGGGFEFLGIFSDCGLEMCDPELVAFGADGLPVAAPGVGGAVALFACRNQYVVGTLAATAGGGYELAPAASGLQRFEGGRTSSGKGFWHAPLQRYLLWLSAHVARGGFTLAREVTLDLELGLLLSGPAREYAALRRETLAAASGSVAAASASLAAASAAAQMDFELTLRWTGAAAPGSYVGVSFGAGAAGALLCVANSTSATLALTFAAGGAGAEACATSNKTNSWAMSLALKPGEAFVSLRVIVDANIVEAFAQGGRAQVVGAAEGALAPGPDAVALIAGGAREDWSVELGLFRLAYSPSSSSSPQPQPQPQPQPSARARAPAESSSSLALSRAPTT